MGLPNFSIERKLWEKGFKIVAGADEVGRGAWAGPVVAGIVVWPPLKLKIIETAGIDDSKKLSPRKREKLDRFIKENCDLWGIGEVPVSVINRLGLARATRKAFREALADCNRKLAFQTGFVNSKVDYLLIDAFYLPHTRGLRRKNQLAVIKGDSKSFSIAAASIIAKVYRDNLMEQYARKYKVYGWKQNKGYGTGEHAAAILQYGLTRLHRKKFVRKLIGSS